MESAFGEDVEMDYVNSDINEEELINFEEDEDKQYFEMEEGHLEGDIENIHEHDR